MQITLMPVAEPIFSGVLPDHELSAVHALYAYKGKIHAIKFLRSAYPGASLLSSKNAVEDMIRVHDWQQVPEADSKLTLGDMLIEALHTA